MEPTSRHTTTGQAPRPAPIDRPGVVEPDDHAWEPGRGRLSEDLQRRHGLGLAIKPRTGQGRTVLYETFSSAKTGSVPGWRPVGDPRVGVGEDRAQGNWIQLKAAKPGSKDALIRAVPADKVAGHVVRLAVKVHPSGAGTPKAYNLPEIALEWQAGPGKRGSMSLPLPGYVSPGWETCEMFAAIPAQATDVRLVLRPRSTAATVALDDVWLEWLDPLDTARVAGTTGPRENLIDGGDFEVGQRNFSVHGARWVPGRQELRTCPLAWEIDDVAPAAVGKRSLRIPLSGEKFRAAFGWARVRPNTEYVVSLYARATTKVVLVIYGVEYPAQGVFERFDVDSEFRKLELTCRSSVKVPWSAMAVVVRPSDLPEDTYKPGPSQYLWIDAVSLREKGTDKTPSSGEKASYPRPGPVDVGIVGPKPDPAEIAHLLRLDEPAELSVRIANYQATPYEGQLAVDVVDAFDRAVPIPQRTIKVSVRPGETATRKLEPLRLARGYYKVLVTAWPGPIGQGRPHATAERAFGVVNLTDAIPKGNYFGMTVDNPRMSRRITQLGAGWVWLKASRQWCETARGKLQWDWYRRLVELARSQQLEVLADLDWTDRSSSVPQAPSPGDAWRQVCREFAEASKGKVDALGVLDQEGIEKMPALKYGELLGQASAEIRHAIGNVNILAPGANDPLDEQFKWLQQAVEGGLANSAEGIALQLPPTPLPEEIEPLLERIQSWRKTWPFRKYIDVGVGQRSPTAYLHVPNLYGYYPSDAVRRPDATDPVLHAARLVRALAIRQYAMIDRAAWWVESYRPPDILRPAIDPQCHEYDNAPRPNLVAFDFMAESLNSAALLEWIDLPQQARALCFERADGDMVVLMWRPFGWSLRPVRLKAMAGKVLIHNLFGQQERHPSQGRDLLVMVNEAPRYLRAKAAVKTQLLEALRQPIPLTPATGGSPPRR